MKLLRIFLLLTLPTVAVFGQRANRTVAVTIDDLPVVSTRSTLKDKQEITRNLLGHIKKAKVPAIGFVNENKLYAGEKLDERQVDLLRMWVDAGLELGNHTFSHRSLNRIELADYEADLLKGEIVTKRLLAEKGKKIRYFRHPFLQTGRTLEVKAEFDKFLLKHGYTIAPVSHDNGDYIFARAYDLAYGRGDKKLMQQVGDAYVPYMEAKLNYWERQSVKTFGREIAQTLLIHANSINAEYFDELAAMFVRRGYKFVDLETALKDSAYRQPDKFVGPAGISWIHRWTLDKGKDFLLSDEPMVPDFVLKLSGFGSE